MTALFSDNTVRDGYVKMVVDWMANTYNISDTKKKNALFASIHAMSDEKILEKGKLIEDYIDSSSANKKGAERSMQAAYNELQEELERKILTQDNSNSLFF